MPKKSVFLFVKNGVIVGIIFELNATTLSSILVYASDYRDNKVNQTSRRFFEEGKILSDSSSRSYAQT